MYKRIRNMIISLLLIYIPAGAAAEKSTVVAADPFPSESPGRYVYYHDMRRGIYGKKEPVNMLIGIMKADNKQYIIRALDNKSGESFLYLGHFILDKGIMQFTPDSMQGDTNRGMLLMADIMNLMNYLVIETGRHLLRLQNKSDATVNSNWEEYGRKTVNIYRWWIPFYKLESCSNAGNDQFGEKGYVSLKLICFGTTSKNDPDMFTRINRIPSYHKQKHESAKYAIPAAERMTVKLDNVTLNLDKNWQFEKADPASGLHHDTYWLKKFTVRDAQIGVESVQLTNLKLEKNEIETFAGTLQYQSCVIADTVSIDLKNKALSLSLWDPDNGTATYTRYKSLGVKNNVLTILNFSAFDFIYYTNMNYFDATLK